ncbi:alpha-galactosidase/6-phospho-beta-glucosidase family protein [Virgibacillus natechei]|uniref:Alpha-galactosidase/6-phospho-beta-glucosidase family protein n=1 Tax=Virgibacillus natechei TaxID=1216297 RepID=A0ABS4IF35_9BACI|nr:alpha-galactosidase/6-phospho-beta-glucosidase family protein [Virgibacillus natechei]
MTINPLVPSDTIAKEVLNEMLRSSQRLSTQFHVSRVI